MRLLALFAFLVSTLAFASPRCDTCTRASNGRIQRSTSAIKEFKRNNPCPSTGKTTGRCPGYVVDHHIGLCVGGIDKPENMRWMTVASAKAKDRWECKPDWQSNLKEKDRWE